MDKKDETTALKARTTQPASRPATKTAAPRLSTTTRSSTTSSTTRPTVGGSLSKPPARPSTTTSTVRKTPGTASTSSIGTHRKRDSESIVDGKPSGDEKSKDGISAKPKRMSLAPSTSSDRATTTKSVTATPARRTTIQPSTTSIRQTSSSPVDARKVAATPTTTPRSRPLASSSSRTAGASAVAEKKRLSTIPASPMVKTGVEEPEDNKENLASGAEDKAATPVRPALGSRKSTRSVLIEQRIREFELVNSMLQAAMTADGADEQEQQSINQEAATTLAKLKSDLAKVREFERSHDRVPTAAELEEIQSVAEEPATEPQGDADAQLVQEVQDASVMELQKELAQSRAQAEALQTQLVELKTKLEQFSKSAEEESGRVQEATEAIREEHAAKINELSSIHETRFQELENAHRGQLRELSDGHVSKTDQLSQDLALAQENADQFKSELEDLRKAAAERASTEESNSELKKELETKIATLQAELKSQLAESQTRLERAETDAVNKQKEITQQQEAFAKTSSEMSRRDQVIQSLNDQVLGFQQASDAQTALISQLEGQIKTLQGEKADASAAAASSLGEVEKAHAEKIEAIKQQLSEAQENLQKAQDLRDTKMQEVLKKTEAEIGAANAELESANASNSSKISDLEAQLQKTMDEAEAKTADHEGALAGLQSQLHAAKTALDGATTNHEKILKDHEAKSKSAQEELTGLRSAHEKELEEIRSGSQSKHEEEIAKLKVDHAERSQQLEEKLHASHKEMSSLKQTHASQIKQLENQMNASLKDLEIIEAGHLEQLGVAKAEASAAQQKAIEEAEKIHIERVRKLEQQLHAAEADVAELRSVHAAHLEDLERQRTSDHEVTLNALKEEHAASINDLEDQLKLSEDSLETVKDEHAEQLKHLEEQITAHHAETTNALKVEHAKQLADSESKAKSSQGEALEELRSSLAEEKRQLESQAKSLQQELEGARSQTQMLKSILQSTEKDGKEKEEQLAKEIEKLKEDTSTSVIKLARMSELQMQHDQLVKAKTSLEAKSQEDMEALRAEHEKSLAELKSSLEEQHKQAIDKVRDQHAQSVESSQTANKTQYEELQKNMKEEHDRELDEIMRTLESQWKSQVEQLEEQNTAAIARLTEAETDHEQALQKIVSEHDAALTKLQVDLEEAREAAEAGQSSNGLDELREQLAQAQEQVKELGKSHNEAMDLATKERDSALATIKQELAAAKEAAAQQQEQAKEIEQKLSEAMVAAIEQREVALATMKQELVAAKEAAAPQPDPSQLEELNKKYLDAQNELAALQEKHDQANLEARAEYDSQLEKVLTELSDAKHAAEKVPDLPEADAIKTSLDEAKKTVTSLESQLEGALLEIETQRNLAHVAQKEVEQLKAQAIELPSPKPRRKIRSPKRKSMNPLSPTTPKAGLDSSRWATPGEDVPALRGGDGEEEDSAAPTATDEAPAAGMNGKSRNVAGQLAGIHEQIKQLDEMSEDFLEDHQKMAGILSRIDDRTQTATIEPEEEEDTKQVD